MKVAIIGMTLKETPTVVTPAGVAGLSFGDEAETVNALVPKLKAQGADAIVVLIHQGVNSKIGYNDQSCSGLEGDLMPILDRLDPAVDAVVSGHTHYAYVLRLWPDRSGEADPAHQRRPLRNDRHQHPAHHRSRRGQGDREDGRRISSFRARPLPARGASCADRRRPPLRRRARGGGAGRTLRQGGRADCGACVGRLAGPR